MFFFWSTRRPSVGGPIGDKGPVTNVDLWIELMDLIDRSVALLEWIKVPSHIGIAGNDRADQLAEEGRKASPLYSVARGRVAGPMTPLNTPPQGPRVRLDDVVPTGMEVTPMCSSGICTPITLRARGREFESPHPEVDPVRRLFDGDMPGELNSEDTMSEDRLVSSPVSSMVSPDCTVQSDYYTSSDCERVEFSTDVSSTRKRRGRNP